MGRKHRMHELFQALSSDDQLTLIHAGESLLCEAPFVVAYDGRFVVNVGGPDEKADVERRDFFRAVVDLSRRTAEGASWAISIGPESAPEHAAPEAFQ